ncbi:AraC family transcriptional regulator [Vibrio sp. ZSDE26]|uniref:AraC family transcriptional regulator n=1 Tax=Vibrio amylolyticus TaxID=2847292 RepID=A0A9X1XLF9_9VIBR|nr:AraC family transcriptional regulator [Vibrio amylolyticus]MCK6261744.1 AraC family transcriptional regulator [Vibrio amylolyticus]
MKKSPQEKDKRQDVYNVLSNNTATLHKDLWLDNGIGSAVWSNNNGSARYNKPGHHTLSFYLQGGHNTQRIMNSGNLNGGIDKLCLMPKDHHSEWAFSAPFSFFHLYFEQSHLQNFAEQVFDKEGRNIELNERTFVDDPFVSQLIRQTMLNQNWEDSTDKLMLSHAQQMLLLHLVRRYCEHSITKSLSTGGLSAANRHRVIDFIEANLSRSFTLNDLATLANLSDFHFARMFKESFQCTPHQYVLTRRIELAKQLLTQSTGSLAEIAQLCGFSSQQHLSSQFKTRVGSTPSVFRREQS